MNDFTIYDADGRILAIAGCPAEELQRAISDAGGVGAIDGAWHWTRFRVVDGAAVPLVPILAELKAKKITTIDAERERRGYLPITFRGALFDADSEGQRNVTSWQIQLATGVELPEGFRWRDAANVFHPADANFVNGLGAAITLRGTALYQVGWALKAQVEMATTPEQLEQIDWPGADT